MALLHMIGIAVIAVLLIVGGGYVRALVAARREARLAIIEREQRFRCLAEATFEGILVHRNGTVVDANAEISRLFGYQHTEVIGLPVDALLTTGDTGTLVTQKRLVPGVPVDLVGQHRDGSTFPVEVRGRLYRAGDTAQIVAIRDLSERETAARALRESESRLRSLVDTVGSAIVLLSRDYRIVEWNREAERLYGRSKGEALGRDYLEEFTTPRTRGPVARTLTNALAGAPQRGFEYPVVAADGTERMVRWNVTCMQDAEGETTGILACGQDITEVEAAHARTLTALKAKEILLQEVYHRVKNNLQVVDSLLNRQAAGLEERLRAPLKDAQSRIRSLAAVHEFLYQTEDLERIDFRAYAKRLAADLRRSHGFDTGRVKLIIDVDEVRLGLETAIPCGLILNELITNTLKYAFPEGGAGEIEIGLHVKPDRHLLLSYRDDGCGSGPQEPEAQPGFGLQLVQDLAYQLGGRATVTQGPGIAVTLCFPCGPDDWIPGG